MKTFSWKILLLLVVLITASTACRLMTEGVSPIGDKAVQEEIESLAEQAEKAVEDLATAVPVEIPTEVIATAVAGQAGEDGGYTVPELTLPSTDDLCSLLPKEIFSPLIGSELTGAPEPFEDDYLGKGCTYDFGEKNGVANFLYISVAPMTSFKDSEDTGKNVTRVPYLPEDAFTVDAADAQQLWAKIDNERALVIATGDKPNPDLALQLAFILVPLLESMP